MAIIKIVYVCGATYWIYLMLIQDDVIEVSVLIYLNPK